MDFLAVQCDVPAEPPYRYTSGGYHPVHLGDVLGNGRYEVIHKLSWGGYSTVWIARDRKSDQNVAIKINVADQVSAAREIQVLRDMATDDAREGTSSCLVQWLDDFEIDGPNGKHICIVTELLGESIADLAQDGFHDGRIPARWVQKAAKQLLIALSYLHGRGIGHGDIHTRNIVIIDSRLAHMTVEELLSYLGRPKTWEVYHRDGEALGPEYPRYIVEPCWWNFKGDLPDAPDIRLIDLGEAFRTDNKPETLNTPQAVRAPEVILGDEWDARVDLWSAGCAIFEMITGQPPFDNILGITTDILISEMVEEIGSLPARWEAKWQKTHFREEGLTLEAWLLEVYLDEKKEAQFTKEQLMLWTKVLRMLMRFEPAERVPAASVLEDSAFHSGSMEVL